MKKAFTLIELLVLVAIIGILAALIIPAIKKAATKSNTAQSSENSRSYADKNK